MSGKNSSALGSPSLQIAGQSFRLRHPRGGGTYLYSSGDAYLRIGPRAEQETEYETHLRMLEMGYPVPKVLEAGEWQGCLYWIEESLGEQVLWKTFTAETRADGCISDASYDTLLGIMCRHAEAQARNPIAGDLQTEFPAVVRLPWLLEELPDLRDRTRRAFERAVERLQVFPGAWCHPDLCAANMCERGVIDLDGAGLGYAGYDVVGALLEPDIWGDGYAYSPQQREQRLTPIDAIFTAHGLPAPSAYAQDFVLCKAINTASGRHEPSDQQRWLYNRYQAILSEYER
jgi:hypothetical protein